ncbi:MAG TPA: alkaline phosphatase family protein [Solimonas sp.]|nr:alkaline phosphatase family protein [Solimonas sp.]
MSKRSGDDRPDASRRRLLTGLAAAPALAGLAAAPGCADNRGPASSAGNGLSPAPQAPAGVILPNPADSGIDHVVIVMMENRSYDHFLGWVPGSDGVQAGARYPDRKGRMVETFHLASDAEYGYQGCGKEDPDHGYDGGRVHLAGGALNGWLATVGEASVDSDKFPVGYYSREDLPFFAGCADHYTVCDRYFHGILASTYPNRIYLHAGETDRRENTLTPSSLPTIWDRLDEKGVSGRYYFHDLPVTAFWANKYLALSTRFEQFLLDAAAGQLANVSIVDPRFVGEAPNGVTNDDHPQADIRNGQAFLNSVYDALRNSPQWERSLMIVVYDEWGGFYDHVTPPVGPVTEAEKALPNDGRLGFRVPAVILGPRARRNHVSHLQFDVNSVLNLLRWRWDLGPLGARSDWSLNMAYALDFSGAPKTEAPAFEVPLGPFGADCMTGIPVPFPNFPGSFSAMTAAQIKQAQHNLEWIGLREMARAHGFEV